MEQIVPLTQTQLEGNGWDFDITQDGKLNATFHNHFQGAEFDSQTLRVDSGAEVTVPSPDVFGFNPPVPQLHFGSWNTDPLGNGTSYTAGSTAVITEDIELYTIWVE